MRSPLALLFTLLLFTPLDAQESAAMRGQELAKQRRAIRRDLPLTDAIRRAHAAQTRTLEGRPGPAYWQLETDFTIYAHLDPASSTISGNETIEIHNNSQRLLTNLNLRLDHNLFRGGNQRGASRPAELTEGMVVTRMAVDGIEVKLTGGRSKDQPTASGLTQTLANIRLSPNVYIAAGESATLEIDWHTKLPGGDGGRGHRMTQRWGETLVQPTQWFPRLAKYDDLRGWDQNHYLGPAEFYNNFGSFDVSIDVPAGWLVSATGVLQNPEEVLAPLTRERLARVLDSDEVITIVGEDELGTQEGERLTWHFVADKVNDFAWASSENYMWRATRASIPGVGPIPVHMLHLPERAHLFQNAGPIARHALEFYSDLWAPYPFPQLTMQDGPSAGMEYPMVINSNQGACDHEVAHQWWPMMLGTNETWYGWMDEGLNTYMNTLSYAHSRDEVPNLDGKGQSYGGLSGNEFEPSMMWISNYSGPLTGFQTYVKTEMMLSMLGGIYGDEEVQQAISDYTHAWKFKHPSPWDFAFFMSHALEADLGWFWYYWLFTTERVDGSIAGVEQRGELLEVHVRQDGEMPAPVVLMVELEEGGTALEEAPGRELLDEDTLLATWPVEVWFDGARSFTAELELGGRKVKRIRLDPYGRFPDKDPRDNLWQPSR